MPTYDYFCPENRRTVAVMHGMSAEVRTWGEACERAGADPGSTSADAPVEKLLGAGMVLSNSRAELAPPPGACAASGGFGGMGCCGGGCGMGG